MPLLALLLVLFAARQAAAASKAEADVYVAVAVEAYQAKRYDEADKALGEALALDPENADALYYTGLVRVAQGRLEDAAAAFREASRFSPGDPAIPFQLGAVYFHLGQDDQARPLLEQAFREDPSRDRLGYYVGMLRYRSGDYAGAISAFRAAKSDDPEIAELTRFYSALALVRLGQPAEATAQIEEALRLQPASPLTGPAERLRAAALGTRAGEKRLGLVFRFGGYYDDNVAVVPSGGNGPELAELQNRQAASPGALVALRGDYSLLRSGAFDATATYSFFSTFNSDVSGLNLIDNLGGLAAGYGGIVRGLPYHVANEYSFEYLTLGGREYVQRHAVAPWASVVWAGQISGIQLQFQDQRYANQGDISPDDDRTGREWIAGLFHIFRFSSDRHLLRLGYQFDYDDTDGKNFRYLGNRVLAGGQYTLPWYDLRVNYSFDVQLRNYQYANTDFPTDAPGTVQRFDTEYNHLVWVTYPLPRNLDVTLYYQRTDAISNLDPFSFTRNVVTLEFAWTY